MDFIPSEIEEKWKQFWEENGVNKVENDSEKEKFYVLDMFPYPSGSGLHVGHPLGYIASDIFSRFKKMKGFNVLHPMGFDAFGLPAEQYAIQTGVHPADSTATNLAMYKKQLNNIGFNYDWSRSVNTSDPTYYKWTQTIFLKLYDAYYDTEADKAKHIDELIAHLENHGTENLTAFYGEEQSISAEDWKGLSPKAKEDFVMNYRLAFRKTSFVNWCEELGTVLANDEVKDGFSERGGHPVEKKAMMQWSLRITAYADRLLRSLDKLEWSEALKAMQRNWIGKSEGAQIFFPIENEEEALEVFTTRPDTIFGATFMVIAPELEVVQKITTEENKAKIAEYLEYVSSKSEIDRLASAKEVTGAFTGAYAIHPFSGKKLPIWISEYVLKDYGSGAIMAVPSDDDRDQLFAEKMGIEIIPVVHKSMYPDASNSDKKGVLINSDFLNGLEVKDAINKALEAVEEKGIGTRKVNFRLRDANYSRQRYWGEPFPISYDKDGLIHTPQHEDLPLELPALDNFKPTAGGKSPLARLDSWLNHDGLVRETDTMPGFAGSSWYFLRYMDPNNDEAFASDKALKYWKDVDLYIGGTEHAVGHLMYSRFWHKFLFDMGLVPTNEPFKKLINQGMIQGVIESLYMLKDKKNDIAHFISTELAENYSEDDYVKISVYIEYVKDYGSADSYMDESSIQQFMAWREDFKNAKFSTSTGSYQNGIFKDGATSENFKFQTKSEVGKMSKRYFNVINPDDVVAKYGADCFRMYEMFLGPIEQSKPWDTKGIDGVSKFLRRLWSLFHDENNQLIIRDETPNKDELKILHKTIKKVSEDIQNFSFNTCVSSFMVAVNELKKLSCSKKEILEPLILLLAPFAPFLSEELWEKLGHNSSVHQATYPIFDESKLVEDEVTYPVCFNGKKRLEATFASSASREEIMEQVLNVDGIDKYLEGNSPKKIIVVPGRMINLVI